MATWTAPSDTRKGPAGARVGIQHGAGMRAIPWLREIGIVKPEGWRVISDSPRRGLVLEVPLDADPEAVVGWLLDAAARLCPLDLPDRWQATAFLA